MNSDEENINCGPPSPVKKEQQTPAHTHRTDNVASITPFKSPNHHVLSPLPKGSTIMPKRRKLSNDKLATPERPLNTFTPLIPQKSRSFSTPAPKRIPSITATPIPDLTPPTSSNVDKSFNSSIESPSSPSTILSSPLKRLPILGDLSGNQLSKEEYSLDQETRNLNKQIEKLKQYLSIRDQKKSEEVDSLIIKWRDASQRSSQYLYNEFKIKIGKIGGWKEFKRQQREQQQSTFIDDELLDQLYEFKESEQYEELDQYERDEIDSKIEIEELKVNALSNIDDISDVEFNDMHDELKEVLKNFGVDEEKFKLIYGD